MMTRFQNIDLFLTTAIVVGAVSVSQKNAISPKRLIKGLVGCVLISLQMDWQAPTSKIAFRSIGLADLALAAFPIDVSR
jgi:hypothetical protein